MAGLTIKIAGDSRDFDRTLNAVVRSSRGFSSRLAGLGKTAGAGLAVGLAAGVAGAGAILTSSIENALDAARIGRVFESQLKNLDSAGRKAFSGATDFASRFGDQIGKDDDDILAVITKLSTFPAAFGKGALGADAMRRATEAAFDLEAAGIGAAESNIIGIGKALNNPIKGVNALARQGVSFTEEQQKQIKNFVKQGQLAKAQQVLLQGIESNAKGAAKASASPLERLQATLGNVGEDLGTAALPALNNAVTQVQGTVRRNLPQIEKYFDRFGNFLSRNLPGAIRSGIGFIEKLPGVLDRTIRFISGLPDTFSTTIAALGPLGTAVGDLLGGSAGGAQDAQGALGGLNTTLSTSLQALTQVVEFLNDVKTAVDGAFGEGTSAKIAGLSLIIGGLGGPIFKVIGLANGARKALLGMAAASTVAGAGGAGGAAAGAGGGLLARLGLGGAAAGAAGTAGAVGIAGLAVGGAIGTGINNAPRLFGGRKISDLISDGLDKTGLGAGADRRVRASSTTSVTVNNNFRTQLTPRQQRQQVANARLYGVPTR